MTTTSPSIHDQGAQNQVILPNSVAFGLCVRGIKTRLGRSLVTLSGVSLGIAFLMSVLSGQLINKAMTKEAERLRKVDLHVSALRGEIGILKNKKILLLAKAPEERKQDLLEALTTVHGCTFTTLPGSAGVNAPAAKAGDVAAAVQDADAMLLLGGYDGLVTDSLCASLQSGNAKRLELDSRNVLPVLSFVPPQEATASKLATAGVSAVRHMLVDLKLSPEDIAKMDQKKEQDRLRMLVIVVVSLLITIIGIANAMLMSVTERFREIGTMKCLGALSGFVVKQFLFESSIIGFIGSTIGMVGGALLSLLAYGYTYGVVLVLGSISYPLLGVYAAFSIVAGVVLSVIAAIYPARLAAKMIPAVALSSHI